MNTSKEREMEIGDYVQVGTGAHQHIAQIVAIDADGDVTWRDRDGIEGFAFGDEIVLV